MAKYLFLNNSAFQKIVTENYDINSLIEIFNCNDEKILKEELCLNNMQFKILNINMKKLGQEKKLVSIKFYIKNLLENLKRISIF